MKIVECVPNFSEGRDAKILEAIATAMRSVKQVTVLDIDPGADTNRTVYTMVGEPEAVLEAAFRAIKTAAELIDMSQHHGAHPRMGATDVCPFIPVAGMTMDDCVLLAKRLGERVGNELNIPVYLYEHAASKPEWKNLATVRQGEYEALPEKAANPDWKPDFGPHAFNAKSGATAIGAREFLIAYNINLNTRDEKKAHDIALMIRESGRPMKDENGKLVKDADGNKKVIPGLFTYCKAVGWYIDAYQRAQISINLTNYKVTPPHIVLEKVRELALEKGIIVTGSEVVGLVPKDSLLESGRYYLKGMGESAGIPEKMILETAIQSMGLAEVAPFELDKKIIEYAIASSDTLVTKTVEGFCDELSTDSPAPGGGSVAALCSALSGALTAMVANLTVGKKGYETVQQDVKVIAEIGQDVKSSSLHAIDRDTLVFYEMMDAMKLPKKTEEEKLSRDAAIQEATKKAILVPFETMEIALRAVEAAAKIAPIGNKNALSDAGVAAITAMAACRAAHLNVLINMGSITDASFKEEMLSKADLVAKRVEHLAAETENLVRSSL